MAKKKNVAGLSFLVAMLLLGAMLPAMMAQSVAPSPEATFCTGLIPSSPVNAPPIFALSTFSGIISITLLIMAAMMGVAAIAYAFGYAFKIDKLVSFSKIEIGEIIVTLLIVAIFLGSIYSTSFSGILSLGPQGTYNVFNSDCTLLSASSIGVFRQLPYFVFESYLMQFFYNTEIDLMPLQEGIQFEPFHGYYLLNNMTITLMNITASLGMLFLAMTVFLAIVYILFPIFFFLGILFRTIPFTRAAGGAFLGIFIGFYIMFPLIIYILLQFTVPVVLPSASSGSQVLSSISGLSSGSGTTVQGGAGSILSPFTSTQIALTYNQSTSLNVVTGQSCVTGCSLNPLDPTAIIGLFISVVIEPQMYTIFVLIIAVMVSLNFSELVGDFLGSESLSSRNVLRKIL